MFIMALHGIIPGGTIPTGDITTLLSGDLPGPGITFTDTDLHGTQGDGVTAGTVGRHHHMASTARLFTIIIITEEMFIAMEMSIAIM
jgi:hypothetical protein